MSNALKCCLLTAFLLADEGGGGSTTSTRPSILERAATHLGSASMIESIEALHTLAHVQAPGGAFEMTVVSARDGRVHFMQQGRFSAGVDRQGGWIWDDEKAGRTPLDSLTASIITGHELHLLVLAPETRWTWTGQVRDSVFAGHPALVAEFRDELGSTALACYAQSDSLPLGFIMVNPSGRGEALIEVELGGWQRRGEWNWFERATFRQGQALFEYQYHEIRPIAADDSLFTPRAAVTTGSYRRHE